MHKFLFAAALVLNPLISQAHDLQHLPLGDNLKSTGPQKGHLWPCHLDSEPGGAFKDGPWLDKQAGTYDRTTKPHVPGDVKWPHQFSINIVYGMRVFTGNDLPDHGTGIYPIPSDSAAFQYDRNPNAIKQQKMSFNLVAEPQIAARASCAPGAVGILLSGVALFSGIDAPGRDAMAHEVQDKCDGHPQVSGVYHYHVVSPCVSDKRQADGSSSLVGYAIDGFGIYGSYAAGGKKLDSKDLDECHGIRSDVLWDGTVVNLYHYVATDDFPYSVGCLRGTPDMRAVQILSGPRPGWF